MSENFRDLLWDKAGIGPDSAPGVVAAAMDLGGPFDDVFQWSLQMAWEEDPSGLRDELSETLVKQAFKMAGFNLSNLPARLTVYRGGTHNKPRRSLEDGWSWTRIRKVAHWFAFYRSEMFGEDPRVIRARVTRSRILATFKGHEKRNEQEIVMPGAVAFEEVPPSEDLYWRAIREFSQDEKDKTP